MAAPLFRVLTDQGLKWRAITAADLASASGAFPLRGLTDAADVAATQGQVLQYQAGLWTPSSVIDGGTWA